MALTTAERNRRKRERKKREKAQERQRLEAKKQQEEDTVKKTEEEEEVEIEYEPEALQHALPQGNVDAGLPAEDASLHDMESVLARFQERSAVVVSDEDELIPTDTTEPNLLEDDEQDDNKPMSKRKWRQLTRPSVADLKRRVARADLVEAHDVASSDPDFLIALKSTPGTVPVPRHWGRKRKYLQGKRGFEKPPFELPDFIVKTGITQVRETLAEEEEGKSAKQRNRGRVAPKMGAMDVNYRTLHDAFFKYQTKPTHLTQFGDLYYEGKELETQVNLKPGRPLSKALKDALGMVSDSFPPPWLINMQRYGPPPSYPSLKIPGVNAPLPLEECQYGYHTGGWGKPPVDAFGRPLYGGNPFDKPGSESNDQNQGELVTSDGKTLVQTDWGALPTGLVEEDESEEEESEEEEESSDEEMEESEEEGEQAEGGTESVLPPPRASTTAVELRKQQAGDETPMDTGAPKQLYTVLQEKQAGPQGGAVFSSEVAYQLPGAAVPEGAESVLSKAVAPGDKGKKKRAQEDDDEEQLDKNFKF